MKVEICAESENAIVVENLKNMIDNAENLTKKQVKGARLALTYFIAYHEWAELPKRYRRGVEW